MINFVYRKIRKFPREKSAKKIINYFGVAEGAASSRCRAPPPPSPARTPGILYVQYCLDPIFIVTYYMKWAKTSLTNSTVALSSLA